MHWAPSAALPLSRPRSREIGVSDVTFAGGRAGTTRVFVEKLLRDGAGLERSPGVPRVSSLRPRGREACRRGPVAPREGLRSRGQGTRHETPMTGGFASEALPWPVSVAPPAP